MAIPRLLTIAEVAAIARAPLNTVRFWIYSSKLASRRVGRRRLVTEDELRTFLKVETPSGRSRP